MRLVTPQPIYLVLGRLIRETDKAVLIRIIQVEDTKLPASVHEWFPLSQIVDSKITSLDETEEDGTLTLDRFNIKEWLIKEKGLI